MDIGLSGTSRFTKNRSRCLSLASYNGTISLRSEEGMTTAKESTKLAADMTSYQHELQCMEVWNGSKHVENNVQTPGFSAWIYSKPYQESKNGGDVYFLTLCMGGVLSRLLLGDVAGHGIDAAATSQKLRQSIRKFINYKINSAWLLKSTLILPVLNTMGVSRPPSLRPIRVISVS